MKHAILKVALLLASASALHSGAAAQTTSAKVVLELFTSQGCSSCPSADALLESYTRCDDVIALSVPVDLVVLLQNGAGGPIINAAKIRIAG